MTDADTQTSETGASPVGAVLTGVGLRPEPGVVDGAGLAAVSGPLLSADIVDGRGEIVATVAVFDDLGSEPDTLLQALAEAALAEAGPGAGVQPAEPVAAASDLAARFTMPLTVAAYSDGRQVRALHLVTADRRDGAGPGAGASVAMPVGAPAGSTATAGSLDKLINVSLDVSVELGRTRVTLADVLDYDVGSVVELDRAAGAPVDIRVNDTLLAQGEVVLIDDEYAVRITAIFDPHKSP
jgi:flagellar motor switch protein FliN/FliY